MRLVLPVLLAAGLLAPRVVAAEEWVEPRFDPPVGSEWTIQRELNVQKVSGGILVGHTLKQTALLTVAEKTADGYVMTYTRQNSSYDGDPAGAAAQRLAFEAQQGLVVRIDTDAAGKPLRIENWAEVKAALGKALATQPPATANPDALAAARRYGERMLAVDDGRAAALFLDALPMLAVAQNTGLRPGEIRKTTLPEADALVDGAANTLTLSLMRNNPGTGAARYLATQTYDAQSVRALVVAMAEQMAFGDAAVPGTIEQAVKSGVVSAVSRAQLDVAQGMTRELRRQSVTSLRLGASRMVTAEDELVVVTPAEKPAAEPPVAAMPPPANPVTPAAAVTPAVPGAPPAEREP